MTTFYLDTSALIKRYVAEIGSEWMRALMSPNQGHFFLTSRITLVEFHSAIARRRREKRNQTAAYDVVLRAFSQHGAKEYEFVELTSSVIDHAKRLLDEYPLRAYDSIQLASAFISDQILIAQELPPLVFISADDRLDDAASGESLLVENPNNYA